MRRRIKIFEFGRRNFMDKNGLYLNELTVWLEEAERFLKLFPDASHSQKNQTSYKSNLEIITDLAQSEYEIISDLKNSYADMEKEKITEILNGMSKLIADSKNPDFSYEQFLSAYHTLTEISQRQKAEMSRNEMLRDVFQLDNNEMHLHEEKLKALQKAVNFDLKAYGTISDIILETLRVQHCTLENGQVTEIIVAEPEPVNEAHHVDAEIEKQFKAEHPPYQGAAYLKGNGKNQKPIFLRGNSPEDILSKLKDWNMTRTADMKLVTCYIRKHNPENNKLENAVKYDVATGADITPIYLKLPNLDRTSFMKVVSEVKANGAKYNYQKKAFYITRQNDLNKFYKYLPISEMQQISEKKQEQIQMIDYDGEKYNLLQYAVLTLAESKSFSPEQMKHLKKELLTHPELSSDSMGKILFAIRDGIPPETVYQPHKETLEEQCKNSIILKLNENKGKIQASVSDRKHEPIKESER